VEESTPSLAEHPQQAVKVEKIRQGRQYRYLSSSRSASDLRGWTLEARDDKRRGRDVRAAMRGDGRAATNAERDRTRHLTDHLTPLTRHARLPASACRRTGRREPGGRDLNTARSSRCGAETPKSDVVNKDAVCAVERPRR
jgi:hypothetical protein